MSAAASAPPGRRICWTRTLALTLLIVLVGGPEAWAQAPDAGDAQPPAATSGPVGPTSGAETAAPADATATTEPPDPSQPMGPLDPFNRGTPRGSVYGFLVAARDNDYERAANYMDLRRLRPRDRARAAEIARRFKVVLDQTLWVDIDSLSDQSAGQTDDDLPASQDRLGDIQTSEGSVTLLLQRVPRTGDGERIWKISAASVVLMNQLYAEFEPVWLEAWLPPFFFEQSVLNLPLWKWLSLLVLLLGAWLVAALIAGTATQLVAILVTRGHEAVDARIIRVVRRPVTLALAVALFAAGEGLLGLDLAFASGLRVAEKLLLGIAALWLAFRLIDIGTLVMRHRAEQRENAPLATTLVPVSRFIKLVVVLLGSLVVLGSLGVNVTAAVAGLGVGGIAVALAAQKTIENLFGGISLFADRPVQVGDFFRYGDAVGTVEEIGLRSTRVRTLDRTVVTIPNAEFASLRLENFATRDRLRLWTMIGVRYETTAEQMRYLLTRLREILIAHPRVTEDPARVRFVGFGAYSLDLEVFAYVDTSDWNEFLAIREDIYLLFMDAVKEAGTGFAFPSSTMYLGRDEGLDSEDTRRAEAQVREWREAGRLPFPDVPDELKREVEGSLDWPPPGSASRAQRGGEG